MNHRMTTLTRTKKRLLSTACLLFLAVPALAQDKDTIQLKDGKTETGKIKSEDYSGLVLEGKGGRTIQWSEIVPNGVTYSGSAEFTSAKENLDNGKFDDALPKLEELKGDTKLRAVIKQNVLYFIPVILQRQGKFDEAIAGYKELVLAFPKSRYLMEVGEGLVNSFLAKGKDYAGASKALDELADAALKAGVEAGFSAGVNVLRGRLFEEQGKISEASGAYSVAEKASGVSKAIVQQSQLGQARTLVALKKPTEAETLYRKLVGEDAPNAVLAGAWNGIGDLLKDEARTKRDSEKMLDALFAYLRGVVQYAPLPGEPTTEYKRAMQGSAECFKLISDLEQNADRKRLYAERARERTEQLKKEFPNG